MCGRFARYVENQLLIEMLLRDLPDLDPASLPALPPSYNTAPTQSILAITRPAANLPHRFELLAWGLIPSFAKDFSGNKPFNARAETVATSPMFRRPFARQRCLVLTNGFYDWRKDGKLRTPFFFTLRNQPIMALAGLYDQAEIEPLGSVRSCTIITTAANALVEPIHNRMPVILKPEDYRRWCDPQVDGAGVAQLLTQFPPEQMLATEVDRRVGNVRHDDPACILPAQNDLF